MAEFSKLNGYDVKDAEARVKLNKKPYYFNTVADMKAYNLKDGDCVITLGYHEVNDGGGADYVVTETESNSEYQEELNNELYATLVVDKYVNPEMFGAYGDSDHDGLTGHDDTNAIQKMFDSGYEIFSLRKCIYKITQSIVVSTFTNRKLTLKGELAYTGSDYAIKFTSRVAECNLEFGNIFANRGGCMAFYPHSQATGAVAGMHLSGNIFYAGNGVNNSNGDCIYVENDGWFNENFIEKINFQNGHYGFRCIYKENNTKGIDLGRLF